MGDSVIKKPETPLLKDDEIRPDTATSTLTDYESQFIYEDGDTGRKRAEDDINSVLKELEDAATNDTLLDSVEQSILKNMSDVGQNWRKGGAGSVPVHKSRPGVPAAPSHLERRAATAVAMAKALILRETTSLQFAKISGTRMDGPKISLPAIPTIPSMMKNVGHGSKTFRLPPLKESENDGPNSSLQNDVVDELMAEKLYESGGCSDEDNGDDEDDELTMSILTFPKTTRPQESDNVDRETFSLDPNRWKDVVQMQYKQPIWPHQLSLHHMLKQIPNLTSLVLDGSDLGRLRDLGSLLPSLFMLSVCNCGLTTLDGVSGFPNLKTLIASNNEIPHAIQCMVLDDLNYLDVSNNPILDYEGFVHLILCEDLKTLKLYDTPVAKRPKFNEELKAILPRVRYIYPYKKVKQPIDGRKKIRKPREEKEDGVSSDSDPQDDTNEGASTPRQVKPVRKIVHYDGNESDDFGSSLLARFNELKKEKKQAKMKLEQEKL